MKDTMYIGNSRSLAQGRYIWSIVTEQMFLSLHRYATAAVWAGDGWAGTNQNCNPTTKLHPLAVNLREDL
jgi:hypothetical protein